MGLLVRRQSRQIHGRYHRPAGLADKSSATLRIYRFDAEASIRESIQVKISLGGFLIAWCFVLAPLGFACSATWLW
jgi:hypothetical protein